MDGDQVDALIGALRERIRLRHLTLDEYRLWGEQAKRVPDFRRIEQMKIRIRSWKNIGWKIDDPAFQRRFLAEHDRGSDRREADAMRYYMQRGRIAGQSELAKSQVEALRSNRDLLERWQYELGANSIDELRGEAQQIKIRSVALRKLAESSISGTDLKVALRDLDEFSALTERCMKAVPRFSEISAQHLPPPIRTDAAQAASRRSAGEEARAAFAEFKNLYAPLALSAIDATSREFLEELKQARKSHAVPLALARFYGAGPLATTARTAQAIAPAYDAHLNQLEAAERAAVQAELARLRAIEAKVAEARAQDLKRRMAGNLAPTIAEVEALLIASSAKKTRAALREEIEFEGRTQYSTFALFFGNRIKTGEYSLSISDLRCVPVNSRQNCTWNESWNWTSFHLFGAMQGATNQMLSRNSGVLRWTESGLASFSEIKVGFVSWTHVRTAGDDSSRGASDSRQTLEDQFMEREIDNRQNYLDRTQSMGSNAAPYNPTRRY